MPEKPKTGGRKRAPPGKEKEKKPQAERFIEAARRLGVDETGDEFERAFRKLVPPKQPKR